MSLNNLGWPAVALAAFGVGTVCSLVSTWLFYVIRAEVNAKVAPDERVRAFGGTPMLYLNLLARHRKLYPKSARRLTMYAIVVIVVLCGVVVAVTLDGG